MIISINKKALVTIGILLGIILLSFISIRSVRNKSYEKKMRDLRTNIATLYSLSTTLCHELYSTSRDFHIDEKKYIDRKTGVFYASAWLAPKNSNLYLCRTSEIAISEKLNYFDRRVKNIHFQTELHSNSANVNPLPIKDLGIKTEIEHCYEEAKNKIKNITPPIRKYKDIHSHLTGLFLTVEEIYNYATSNNYSIWPYCWNTIDSLTSNYEREKSLIDLEIGPIVPFAITFINDITDEYFGAHITNI